MQELTVPANDTTVVPEFIAAFVVKQPQLLITRYEPVAARIVGGGTSSVVPGNSYGVDLPDGALLVSCADQGTSTSVF